MKLFLLFLQQFLEFTCLLGSYGLLLRKRLFAFALFFDSSLNLRLSCSAFERNLLIFDWNDLLNDSFRLWVCLLSWSISNFSQKIVLFTLLSLSSKFLQYLQIILMCIQTALNISSDELSLLPIRKPRMLLGIIGRMVKWWAILRIIDVSPSNKGWTINIHLD